MFKRFGFGLMILFLAGAIVSACNFPVPTATPEEMIESQVAATVQAVVAQAESQESDESPTEVPAEENDEVVPTATAIMIPTEPVSDPPPATEPVGCVDQAGFIADLTVPDDTEFEGGGAFVKSWRLQNTGTCTWTSSYSLVYSHGDQMSGPAVVPLMGAVAPGGTIDLSVSLVAPGTPGTYQGFWKLRNSGGLLFGLGGNSAFWVRIKVPAPAEDDDDIVLFPQIPIIPLPLFASSGTNQPINDNQCFDLDEGLMISCSSAAADFRYEREFLAFQYKHYIRPMHGATFATYGPDKPSSADCQAAGLSHSKLKLYSRYVCYQTSNGKYGWILGHNIGNKYIRFDWTTYFSP